MVMENSKFIENYNSWKMYLQIKILALDVFTYILPPPPLSSIDPAVSGDHDLEY